MLIYPAIDIRGGRCVRLAQGDFDAETRYGDPIDQACAFAEAGAAWIHVVDLDGAQDGAARQRDLIGAVVEGARVNIQCGGGVRTAEDVDALLDLGVARVVVGSAAVKRPEDVLLWIGRAGPQRICAAFDVKPAGDNYMVATEGWTQSSGIGLIDAIARFPGGALRHALVTDVSRDGTLSGPNLALYADLVARFPHIAVQASGGVAGLADLDALRAGGVAGAIVGRALYEKRFTLEDALAG